MAYIRGRIKVKEDKARKAAQDHADANSKILGNVVGVEDAKRCDNAAKGLDSNRKNHDPVVARKEAIFGHVFAVQEDDADEEGWKQRVQ